MGTKDDGRVMALNEYVLKLEQELKDCRLQIIKQCEYIVESDLRRKKFYERIAKGEKTEPISQTDAQYYMEQITDSIVGLHRTILLQKEKLNELNRS